MNILALSGFTNGFISLFLSVFIYLKNRKKAENQLVALVCFGIAIWGLFYGLWQNTVTETESLIFLRILMIGPIVSAFSFYCFSLKTLNLEKQFKIFSIIFSAISIFVIFLIFTPIFIKEASSVPYYYSFWPKATIGVNIEIAFGIFLVFFSIILLVRNLHKFSGYKKLQMKYWILAGTFWFLGVSSNAPPWYGFYFPPYGNFLVFLSPLLLTYAIIKYRFMDIRFALSRLTIYLLSFFTILSFAFSLIFFGNKFAGLFPLSLTGYTILGLILTASTLLYSSIYRFFETIASKYFYYTVYNYQNVLADLGEKLTRILDLNELSFLITDTLLKTIKLNKIAIFLKNGDFQIKGLFGFERKITNELAKNDFLINRLSKLKTPLSIEELSFVDVKDPKEKETIERFKSEMQASEVEICFPLLLEDQLVGMIVLGSKMSGDPYFKQDIDLLSALASQASIALQNARLYSEVKGFSAKLEQEVADRTEELKEANEELKKLDHVKTEFLSITSHQLKTPLAAIKGYSSLLLDGTYGKITKKATEPVKNIQQINEKLITLITDLLNITRMDMGKMTFDFKELAMEDIVDELVTELKIIAQKKNLFLQWEKPIGLPKVFADAEKIRQVVLNIIDNAIKYTRTGGVTIRAENDDSKIKVEISDTGLGIKKEEIETIFKGFDRGQNVQKAQIDGVGLGLMFARKIVEAHKGKIWAESEGENTGSTFFIELPIKK